MYYHFSEESDIEQFRPRELNQMKVVWAVDEEHSVNYFFPRECPRIICQRPLKFKTEDAERLFQFTTAGKIIVIERRWYEKVKDTTIYKYFFNEEDFELYDKTAGYYITSKEVVPIKVEPINNLLDRIVESGAELRIVPNLYPLRDAIIKSSLNDYSIIRFRNAIND